MEQTFNNGEKPKMAKKLKNFTKNDVIRISNSSDNYIEYNVLKKLIPYGDFRKLCVAKMVANTAHILGFKNNELWRTFYAYFFHKRILAYCKKQHDANSDVLKSMEIEQQTIDKILTIHTRKMSLNDDFQ